MSPYEGEGEGEQIVIGATGFSRESLDNAIRAAVHAANQPHGTRFIVGPIKVESVGDPNVGGYWVTITPGD